MKTPCINTYNTPRPPAGGHPSQEGTFEYLFCQGLDFGKREITIGMINDFKIKHLTVPG